MKKQYLSEVNRVREIMGLEVIMEQELLYEDMDASNIDLESALEATTDEWTLDNWDDLDDNLKETFRQHEEFQNMDENAIRQKFNSMDSVSICKIARFLFGWVVKLFKAPLNYMDKQLRSGMGGRNYKRSKAWPCR
jgi:hypothetical protein